MPHARATPRTRAVTSASSYRPHCPKAARLFKSSRQPQRPKTRPPGAGPLLQSGKEYPEPRNFHIFRPTAASAASTCRTAKQAAKAATHHPIQNPSLPRQRRGSRPAGRQRRNQHSHRPRAARPMLAQHLAPAPSRALHPIAALSKGCTPFQKLPPTAASQGAPAGRWPALAEREGRFETPPFPVRCAVSKLWHKNPHAASAASPPPPRSRRQKQRESVRFKILPCRAKGAAPVRSGRAAQQSASTSAAEPRRAAPRPIARPQPPAHRRSASPPSPVLSRLCTGAAPRPRNRPQAGAAPHRQKPPALPRV